MLSLVGLVGLFIVVRRTRPEQIVDGQGVRRLTESLVSFQPPGGGYLPSSLLARFLNPMLSGSAPDFVAAALLFLTAVLLAVSGYAVFQSAFPAARSLALSARGQWLSGESNVARAVWWVTRPLPGPVAALTRKDLLHLGRDATQWSQLLLIVGLAVIYLFNMSALPVANLSSLGISRQTAADAIAVLNLLPAGFVLSAVALRFVYAAISLEGRAIWIALSAPAGLGTLISAKIAVGFPILIVLGLALVLGTNALVAARPVSENAIMHTAMTLMSLSAIVA
ncbi:MAG: hypothetical protein AAFX94_24385, partial [Myxococcota bacterium]